MRLRSIVEKKEKDFFNYHELSNDMWRQKVHDEQDAVSIDFDLENDYDVTQREIVIDQNEWDFTKCKFACELRSAGGDWQNPVLYFRCQLKDGYAKRNGKSIYSSNSHFIFIPGKDEGNGHLVKTKKGWTAPDDDNTPKRSKDNNGNEHQAWEALKKHLKKLVDDEIADVRKEDHHLSKRVTEAGSRLRISCPLYRHRPRL
jgi:hypothetical protein